MVILRGVVHMSKYFLLMRLVLIVAIIFVGVSGYSQTIGCDGLAVVGSGNFNNAAPCPPLDYIYKIEAR